MEPVKECGILFAPFEGMYNSAWVEFLAEPYFLFLSQETIISNDLIHNIYYLITGTLFVGYVQQLSHDIY